MSELEKIILTKERELSELKHRAYLLRMEAKEKVEKDIRDSYKLNADHIKLLKNMEFVHFPDGGDMVCIGVDGKRPFGYSSISDSLKLVLGWRWYEDEEKEIYEKYNVLMKQLPLAINEILKNYPEKP